MTRALLPYSVAISVAITSVFIALGLGWLSPFFGGLYFCAAIYSLALLKGKSKEQNTYKKVADQISILGLMLFLPLIFTLGLTSALLIFVIFAQLSLNLQTYEKRQVYLGLLLGFSLITFSASESRDGGFLFLFIPFSIFLCATLFLLKVENLQLSTAHWLKSSGILLVVTLIIYLLIPRLPALQIGAVSGSSHFYHDQGWVDQSEHLNSEEGADTLNQDDQLKQTLNQLQSDLESFASNNASEESTDSEYQYDELEADDFGLENNLRLNSNIVMYVRSDHPLYLSADIFDRFDGLTWSKSNNKEAYSKGINGEFLNQIHESNGDHHYEVGYEVELVQSLDSNIPLAWIPTSLNFPASALKVNAYGNLISPSNLKSGTKYGAHMRGEWYEGRLYYPELSLENSSSYLTLPSILDSRVAELSNQITKDQSSTFEKAKSLEAHLRTQYDYTLDTAISSQGKTPLSEFLFETKFGHCEYFASAMAVMLRTIGIPSRVIKGYAATDINPLTGLIEVRGTDAHAWVEAYIEGKGWMPFEPTAYYHLPKEPSETQFTYESVNEYVERQLEIMEQQEQSYSLKNVIFSLWQTIAFVFVVIASTIKWVIFHYGIALVVGFTLLVLSWMGWKQVKPILINKRLVKNIENYRLTSTLEDYEFILHSINQALVNNSLNIAYSTVDDLLSIMCRKQLITLSEAESFLAHFNASAYSADPSPMEVTHLEWTKGLIEKIISYEKDNSGGILN